MRPPSSFPIYQKTKCQLGDRNTGNKSRGALLDSLIRPSYILVIWMSAHEEGRKQVSNKYPFT